MSISITINNINTLSDTERAVLRVITGEAAELAPSVADSLKQTVRDMTHYRNGGRTMQEALDAGLPFFGAHGVFERASAPPVELTEVFSPLTQVIDSPAAPVAPAPAQVVNGNTLWVGADTSVAPAPAPAPVRAELDANGLPWDKRIHSSSRAKVADGTWRYARNLDKALIATVEAELRAVQAIPVPTTTSGRDTPVFGDAQTSSAAAVPATPNGWPFGTGTPGRQDATAAVQDTAPAPTALPLTFAQLMQHVTPLLVSGKLTQPILQQAVEKCGLPHLAALGARPDLVETVKAAIDEAVGGVQ